MRRFDQGSVVVPNLKVGRAGKGRTAESRMDRASVQPPNLVRPTRASAHTSGRARMHTHTYARAYMLTSRLGEVRRLDRSRIGAGFRRPTFRPTSQPLPILRG